LRATCFLSFNELGGGLIKQRVARPGQGKSGGFAPSLPIGAAPGRYSCLALPRAIGRTLMTMSCLLGSGSAELISGWMTKLEAAADELMEVSYGEED
jgi:hypothetical protein